MLVQKQSITDQPEGFFEGKRVLVRTDFNVPMSPEGQVTSDYRIKETLPTLQYLVDRSARVIIVTHMGRPEGEPNPKYVLSPVVETLVALLPQVSIAYAPHSVTSPETLAAVDKLQPGQILVLENIRFEPGETKNDPALSRALATLADIYVDDAFGTAHRAHSSTEGVAHELPVRLAGLLMKRELAALTPLICHPELPYTAIVGGSKISTKIGVLSNLLDLVSNLVIGGGMVFTFLKAQGYGVGQSMVEDDYIDTAKQLLDKAQIQGKRLILPIDIVVADRFAADSNHQVVPSSAIPEGWMGLDLGPESTTQIIAALKTSKTVLWNGPLGVFEFPAYAEATQRLAESISQLTQAGQITSVLGGGDTEAAIQAFHMKNSEFTHVSTGGGATMEFLEGKVLPGVAILQDKAPVSMV